MFTNSVESDEMQHLDLQCLQKISFRGWDESNLISHYGKCSKISNILKLRTPKIIAENNF